MKLFLMLLFSIFTFTIAFAQQTIDVNKDEYNASNFYTNVSGNPIIRAKFVSLVDGSPFYIDEWLKSSIITPQGKTYKDVPIKLDLMDGTLHYLDAKGNEFIATMPIKEIVLKDAAKNKHLRFISSFSLPMVKEGWYELLLEGKISLYKTYEKVLREDKPYGSATFEQRIATKEKYVLVQNDRVLYLKNYKDVPAFLADKKKELEAFTKSQNHRLPLEDKLIALVSYYNTL